MKKVYEVLITEYEFDQKRIRSLGLYRREKDAIRRAQNEIEYLMGVFGYPENKIEEEFRNFPEKKLTTFHDWEQITFYVLEVAPREVHKKLT